MSDFLTETPEEVFEELLLSVGKTDSEWRYRFGNALARERNKRNADLGVLLAQALVTALSHDPR